MDWSPVNRNDKSWTEFFCVKCHTSNWTYAGSSLDDGTDTPDDGFECRKCGHVNLWSIEYTEFGDDEDINPEDAIVEVGRVSPSGIAESDIENEIDELRRQVKTERDRAKRFDKRIAKFRSSRNYKDKTAREDELYKCLSDILDGSIQDYINQHGDKNLMGCKSSLLKRMVGQLCSLDARRILLRKILITEQEALLETELLLDQLPEPDNEQDN